MPGKTATRQELAAVLYRNAGSPAVEGKETEDFADNASVAGWAADAMEWCVEEGILKGNENTLMPEHRHPGGAGRHAAAAGSCPGLTLGSPFQTVYSREEDGPCGGRPLRLEGRSCD